MVTISGAITFDLVPLNAATNGLNYAATSQQPARGVIVEAVDAGGAVLESTVTNDAGLYAVEVDANTDVRIRARARTIETTLADWDVTVRDNTNGNAVYVLSGGLTNSGSANSTRNLNAPSGWGGTSYTGTRAAAPFALLDVIYEALLTVNAVTPGTAFPDLQVFWSVDNRAASGDVANGEIGTTSFTTINNVPTILVLGNANNDTDEYDRHVVAHEFGHYLENALARSDSIGGPHSLGDRLDPRVAWSEGFANAYSAIVENDPIYRDSGGAMQASGFSFNIESNSASPEGWFNEASVHSVVYDIFDSASDGVDGISAGFGPIWTSLTSAGFLNDPAPVTIFNATNAFRANASINNTDLDALLSNQSISGTGSFGAGETNDGGLPLVLPVVQTLTVGAAPIEVCSVDDAGTQNKLGNIDFMRLTIPTTGSYTFTMTTASGPTGRDPDFFIFQSSQFIAVGGSAAIDSEVLTTTLQAGDYWISARDFFNTNPDQGTPADVCFDFSVV